MGMIALRDLPPWARAPILGFGLGAVAGGFEAVKLAATLKLALSFGQAMALALAAVGMDALLGLCFAIPAGVVATILPGLSSTSRRHALGMALTATALGAWFLVPAARVLLDQGRTLAAGGFLLSPVAIGGVVWFNAAYWLRREEVGEEHRVGWRGWSLVGAVALSALSAAILSNRSFGGAQALDDDPAVILVTIDTLRRDHVSAYADDPSRAPVRTPVLDALAAEGILYTDAITPFPETAPAHSAMFTGLHPYRTGMLSNGHKLSAGYTTVAERLAAEGYATAAFVSSFAVDSRTGLDQGFEVYDDELFPWVRGISEILAARLATRVILRFGDPLKFDFLLERPAPVTFGLALDWLADNKDKPFFLWVHTFDVHSPYEPHGMPGFEDNGTPGAPSVDHRYILAHEQDFTYTDEVRQKLRRLYAEEVAWTDARLGEFLDAVDALDIDRDVLLIVTADHGEMLGEHAIEMNHHGVYDPAVRIPLIIRPIRVSGRSRVVDEQVRLMDLPATILGQLKLDPEPMGRTESVDLLHFVDLPGQVGIPTLLMGRKTASLAAGTLYGMRANATRQRTEEDGRIRTERGRIKYILDPDEARELLFDLDVDPEELQDLSAEQPEVVERLRGRVAQETGIRISEEGGRLRFTRASQEQEHQQSASEEDLQRLRALGYVDE
ncbi:MAG: hypothetical protein D6798_04730 [Deltaproteobacteria bacterium]|nr:MAG: hypothetical protein D6798_04730 [Deltaproteobacteria bacterium]